MDYHATRVLQLLPNLLSVLLVASSGGAQAPGAPPREFAVASVKPNQAGNAGGEGSVPEKIATSLTGVTMRNVSLRTCICWAYGVHEYQVSGPGWLASQRYDVDARSSDPASHEELRGMMESLLAARFHLALHRESKELPVYAMRVGKKSGKLHPAVDGESSMRPAGGSIVFQHYSMADLGERLAARPFSLDRVVLDETNLGGAFDFALEFADNATNLKHTLESMEGGGQGPSMITILQQQLGLVFKARKALVESLVIDRAEKTPTPN
jgi:uncharacterized protein (TIGR03435 family)